jgi:PilZ domain-containing protein
MSKSPHAVLADRDRDRRMTPRFACCGQAQITYLPSDGVLLRGRLRNLGLGGCYIETGSPFVIGARTEVLLQANALCFRAMAQVRAVREKTGIGLEFIRLSTGGYRSLAEALVELEQQQALLRPSVLHDARLLADLNSRFLPDHRSPTQMQTRAAASVETLMLPPQCAPQTCVGGSSQIIEVHPTILEPWRSGSILDLFG